MKRYFKLFLVLTFILTLSLSACGNKENIKTEEITKPSIEETTKEDLPTKPSVEETIKVTMDDLEVTYDGKVHSLKINETLDEGYVVKYLDNNQTDAGTYEVVAMVFKGDKVITSVSANLIIKGLLIEGVTFNDRFVYFDHKTYSLEAENLPTGVSVKYENNSHSEVGKYEVKAILSGKNYETLVLKAYLIINDFQIDNVLNNFLLYEDGRNVTNDFQLTNKLVIKNIECNLTWKSDNKAIKIIEGKDYNTAHLIRTATYQTVNLTVSFKEQSKTFSVGVYALDVYSLVERFKEEKCFKEADTVVSSNFTLPTTYVVDGLSDYVASISFKSMNPELLKISDDGKTCIIGDIKEEVFVTLIGTFTYQGKTKEEQFKVILAVH